MLILYPPEEYPVPVRKTGQEVTPESFKRLELFSDNSSSKHDTTYSEFPVSDRNIISDHATNEPLEVTEDITLYDDPSVYLFFGQQQVAESEEFSTTMWNYLETLRLNFAVLEVLSFSGYYPSMTIRSLRPVKNLESGNTIGATIVLREFQTTETIETFNAQLDPENADTNKQSKTSKDKGKLPKKQVEPTSKKGVDRTTLDTLYNAVL